ncbi:MAG: VWA domain-containing protein [Spirochaetota bacterium]
MKIISCRTHRSVAVAVSLLAAVIISSAPSAVFPDNAASFETAKELFGRGYIYFNKMNYLAAAEYFRKAVSAYPDYYTAREYLARSYRLAGYNDEALTEWEMLYSDSDTPAVKSKIDALRFRDYPRTSRESGEFVFARNILSNDLGRRGFPYPSDIALDADKNLYVSSFSTGRLVKFNAAGEHVLEKSFGMDSKIYGVACSGERLAVSVFSRDSVEIVNRDFSPVMEIGGSGEADGKFHGPEGLCFDKKGCLYVVDSGNSRVQKFSPDGKFILSFGKAGAYEGDLSAPSSCAAVDGRVYVTDSGNSRIAVFDDSGNFSENIAIDALSNPKGICAYGSSLLIADEKGGVCIYDRNEKTSVWFKNWKSGDESFSRVYACAYDRDGTFYALDHGKQTVFVFTPLSAKYTNLDIEIASIDISKYPLVAFYLNIRDRSGVPVYGLIPSHFEVTEDSAHIRSLTVDYLKSSKPSVSTTLVVDRSLAAKPYHKNMPWVADFFLKKMRKDDSLKVMNVSGDYWTGNDFDWSRRRALKSVEEQNFSQGKKIGKALYNAVGELAPRINRRSVVFVTDGSVSDDSFSSFSPRQVIQYARAHFIPIYIVSFAQADPVLRLIAEETGGAVIKASDADTLDRLYDTVKNSEEYRYVLVYRSFKNEDFADWWSDVAIKISMNGVSGVEWGGYYVPLPEGMTSKPSHLKLPSSSSGSSGGGAAAGGH